MSWNAAISCGSLVTMATGLEEIGIRDDVDDLPPLAAADARPELARLDDARELARPAVTANATTTNRRRVAPVILLEQPVAEPAGGANPNFEQWLARVPLLRGIHPRHIQRIARIGFEERHEPGSYIFRYGDHGEDIFIVLEGTIRILRTIGDIGEEALAILRPGHHFGEMSFLDAGAKRSADARVQHGARVLRLPMRPLRDLMFVDRDLAHDLLWRFVHGLTKRVRDSNDRLTMFTSSARF